ncbi:MAG: hypothetical protein Q3971_03410 [Moraxella sp.]|nr:hypothetical protein [Moraxella sp.]
MSMGFWVVLVVVAFVIGNVMALKPKVSDVRLGQMRLFARKIGLNPKLSPTPTFIATPATAKMMANYTLINDAWRLPLAELTIKDGKWHSDTPHPLSGQAIDHQLSPYFQGLSTKANSICLYWHDEAYVKSFGVRDDTACAAIEQDLQSLKAYLTRLTL